MRHIINPYILDPSHPLTVAVVGVGGTGSFVLSKLARLNVVLKELHDHPGIYVKAYDPDIIEDHNYVRSNFSKADSGMNKATTLISRINKFYGLNWAGHDYTYESHETASNIVIVCVDSLKARKKITEKLKKSRGYHASQYMYMIDVGNDTNHGQILLTSSKNDKKIKKANRMTKYLWELYPNTKDGEIKNSCSMKESISAQSLFINEVMAIYVAEMLKTLITSPIIDYNQIFVNLGSMSTVKTFKN